MDASLLTRLQNEAISLFPATLLPNHVWQTKCNFALQYIANGLGCHDLNGLNATDMVLHAIEWSKESSKNWNTGDWSKGVDCAKLGGLAFLGIITPSSQPHGHVASIAVKPMQMSPSWGILVPWVANIGIPPNTFKLASAAFLLAQRPILRCFWKNM